MNVGLGVGVGLGVVVDFEVVFGVVQPWVSIHLATTVSATGKREAVPVRVAKRLAHDTHNSRP